MDARMTWSSVVAAVVVALVAVGGSVAMGTPLNLTQQPPDVFSVDVQVDYLTETQVFTASGSALTFDIDGDPLHMLNIDNGTFDISAVINASGTPGSGSLEIGGTIPSLGANSGTLLKGDLLKFGYTDNGGEIFEFVFVPTDGDLLSYYPGQVGVILDGWSTGFTGSFDEGFSNDGDGVSDSFAQPVAEPAGLSLIGLMLFGLNRRSRRS